MDALLHATGNLFPVAWHWIAIVERVDEFFDSNLVRFWLSDNGFALFLNNLQTGEA